MTKVKPPNDFKAGQTINKFDGYVEYAYEQSSNLTLDLSDVIFMDTASFRWVFENYPKFNKIIPPNSDYVIERYNDWLDSLKGLSK